MIKVTFSGLDRLARNMKKAPAVLERELHIGLGQSLLVAEAEAKRRSPVDTGNLRSSIAGAGGYSYVNGLQAGMGTNVKYAFWVEVNERARHPVGQAHFMQEGAESSVPFIQKIIEEVLGKVATSITSSI